MPGRDLFWFFAFARKQIEFLIGAAINREMEFELAHSEIIFGMKLGENFFDLGGFGVTPRFRELDDGFLVVESFHRIFFNAEIALPVLIG